MLNVFFENSKGKQRLIGTADTTEQANKIIQMFLKEHNYTMYYSRRWKVDDNTTKIDVGSYTEFFYIQETEPVLRCK